MSSVDLKRSVSLPFLIFYGVGTIVGGGFYALLGEVVGLSGMATPIAFLLTGLLAMVSAFSFAELSARFPVSAGEAQYVDAGFGNAALTRLTGWLVMATGIVSTATLCVASAGFIAPLLPADLAAAPLVIISLLYLVMFVIAAWGIGGSVLVVSLVTIIEVGALVYVFVINADVLTTLPSRAADIWPTQWTGVFAGAFLAFYAFIGFEDMVNLAEEVKSPRRNMPLAIFICIGAAGLLYVAVALVAVLAVSPEALANSPAPVAALASGQGWWPTTGLWMVSILAGLNGALVQIIMAARVGYGMARAGRAPAWLGAVHKTRRTPIKATALVVGIGWMLASFLPIATLAEVTSGIVLLVFTLVNLALWRLKVQGRAAMSSDVPNFPNWLPLLGFLVSGMVLLFNVAMKFMP